MISERFFRALRLVTLFAVLTILSACKVVLYTGISETEANKMISLLSSYGVDATKIATEKDGVTIEVDKSDFSRSVDILNSFNLPSKTYTAINDLFKSDSIVKSPVEEWTRYSYALSQELSKSIATIPSVVSASVNLSYPIKDSPFEEKVMPSASVLVLIQEDAITPETIPQIKQIVAFGVENLQVDRIGVVLVPVTPPQKIDQKLSSFGGVYFPKEQAAPLVMYVAAIGLILSVLLISLIFISYKYYQQKKSNP